MKTGETENESGAKVGGCKNDDTTRFPAVRQMDSARKSADGVEREGAKGEGE